jgi:hypothetical protein
LVSEAFNIRFHWFPPGELSGIQNGLANGPLASVGSAIRKARSEPAEHV